MEISMPLLHRNLICLWAKGRSGAPDWFFSSKSFLWWRNWGFIWRCTIDVKVLVKSEPWSENQLRSLPEFPALHAELNSCWDFHWTPFRSVWLLSLPSMLFELELTSAHLWALLLLIRPVLKVNTSIYMRKVPSVHQPKSKYTLRLCRANTSSLATQLNKKYSATTQTSTIILSRW